MQSVSKEVVFTFFFFFFFFCPRPGEARRHAGQDVDCCYIYSELSVKLTGKKTKMCTEANLLITSVLYEDKL